jgi:hypothetical protein
LNKHPLESYSSYLDGHCLSDAEVEGLREWISADEQNAEQFIEFAILHAALTDRLRLGRLLEDLATHRTPSGIRQSLLSEAIREIESNSPRVIIPAPQPEAAPQGLPMWQTYSLSGALAAVLLIAVWGFWQGNAPLAPPQAPKEGQPIAAATPPQASAPKIAATLSTSFDAQWAGKKSMALGRKVVEGERLSLKSGVVKLDMLGGAAVVVEGPSELKLTGPDAFRLDHGKAAVRVALGAASFVVDTPTMQVVDLGTEFGVQTGAAGDNQVAVFDGKVALERPSPAETQTGLRDQPVSSEPAVQVGAGYQVSLPAGKTFSEEAVRPEVLTNSRQFLRPDEIDVRLRALAGSQSDQKLAAHYERQRLSGLLAYEGFDAASGGAEFALGMSSPAISPQANMQFVSDAGGDRSGIDVQGGPVFLLLDTSPAGPLSRAGLLADSGRIGRPGKELWLTWRCVREKAVSDNPGSAGVSLMFGDRSDLDEPVFFGRGFGTSEALLVQSAWGDAPPPDGRRITSEVDFDVRTPGVQAHQVDEREHVWVARVEFRDGTDRISVWVDVDLSELNPAQPQAVLEASEVEFDRIRMAVNRGEAVWRFSDFAAAADWRTLERLSHVAEFQADK